MSVLLVILGLFLFVALVVVHEYGHFIMARRNGVEVEEFGIGFPPKVWGKKMKSGFLFTVNALPLGGFVRLKGEHDADTAKGSYGAASLWVKTKIIAAGIVMNILVAVAMFTLLALIGMPKLVENQFTIAKDTKVVRNEVLIGAVSDNSPAEQAGLQARDKLVSIGTNLEDAQQISDAASLPQVTEQFAGQKVQITYEREGVSRTAEATLRTEEDVEASKSTDNPLGYLGVAQTDFSIRRSTWSAPIVGVGVTAQFAKITYQGLWSVISGLFRGDTQTATSQVAGPVGVFVLLRDGSELGILFVLMIIALISMTLAIMNSLPIPALDGGRLFVTYIYRLLKKPLTAKAEEMIHGAGFVALMILFVLITIVDVRRFF
jgi:regulator of sigma E protease